MLKIATVFSGIGAIEHALKRMGIKHEIVFACDNGGINVFDRNIKHNIKDIENEIRYLRETINDIDIENSDKYVNVLLKQVENIEIRVNDIQDKIDIFKLENTIEIFISESLSFLKEIEVSKFNTYYDCKLDKSTKLNLLKDLKNYLNRKKDCPLNLSRVLSKVDKLTKSSEYKHITGEIRDSVKNLNQLHEKIETLKVIDKLTKIDNNEDKKKYVDSLYNKSRKTNFVKKSYFANYRIDEERFHNNVAFLDGTQYQNKVDLFVGGSPCQSFSMVGSRKGLEDTRGTLFYDYARLIHEIQPKVFIYENVKGVINHDNGKTWDIMSEVFDGLNYTWEHDILNSKHHGIPQNRERLFVVGFRNDLKLEEEFNFPPKKELTKTMKDFLIDNVSGKYYLNKKGVAFVTKDKNIKKRYTQIDGDIQLCQKANQQFNWHGDFVFVEENKSKEKLIDDLEKYFLSEKVKRYVLSSGTKDFYSKPEINLDIARPLLTTMHKMHRAGVDNYVETEGRLRKLTPRECLRLMGFCDSFKQVVSDTQMYQQAGNSIVVDVLIDIVQQILKSLPQMKYGRDYNYRQDNNANENTNEKEEENLSKQINLYKYDIYDDNEAIG
ncbi:MAG: DNA (cytosine-5-)-methyltransferase [Firmicutes bacterium]|nr:DNA (cytosine-5-)-methyltransferase [Bacillota bacterium]